MIHIRVSPTAREFPRDINLPEDLSHRSGGRSLLLIPGQSLEITEEEWEFVKAKHSDLLPGIQDLTVRPAP